MLYFNYNKIIMPVEVPKHSFFTQISSITRKSIFHDLTSAKQRLRTYSKVFHHKTLICNFP